MRATIIACALASSAALVCGCSSGSGDKKPTTTYGTMKPPPQGWKAAVGDGGTLLETFDDSSWDLRKINDHDLFAVSCIDNVVGWAVGADGSILHTQDGGWSWPAQHSGVTSTLRAVSFAFGDGGEQIGLAVGDAGSLLTSRDGGEHWTASELTDAGTLRGTAVTEGAGLMLAVGDAGLALRSTDHGEHFSPLRIEGASDLYDIALDATGGLALAVDSAGGIWVSRDLGKTFEREYQAEGALESVTLGRSATLGAAAGAHALLRDRDGSWRTLDTTDSARLHATLVGPREERAYFAGENGTLLETVDGGQSLFRVPADTHAALRGIEDLEAR
jgi:photosystem II stability/assembly factor-like uncharacterized protein